MDALERISKQVNDNPIIVDLEQFEHFQTLNDTLSDTFRYDHASVPNFRLELENELIRFTNAGGLDA